MHSIIFSSLEFLYFVAGEDICLGANTAANVPKSQLSACLNLTC